jgi:hypothetical protein
MDGLQGMPSFFMSAANVIGDAGELGEGGLEVFDDFGGDDSGRGIALFQGLHFEPEDVRLTSPRSATLAGGSRPCQLTGSQAKFLPQTAGLNFSREFVVR